MSTRKEIIEEIKKQEALRQFDTHVDPINYDNVIRVDANYHYISKPFKERMKIFFERIFIVKPFILYINKIKFRSKVYGKTNLKGIKKAIITCNHVDMFDCLAATRALKPHKLYITAAPFNNQKGFLGEMMRAGRMVPMSEDYAGMKNFNRAIDHFINTNNYVMFYPEASMWWHYKKPRPLKNGAYHFAVKHNVAVVPLLITFTSRNIMDEEGLAKDKFHLHILKPIYLQDGLTKTEQIQRLKDLDLQQRIAKYEEFYQTKYEL